MGLDVFEKPRLCCAKFLHEANGQQRFLRVTILSYFPVIPSNKISHRRILPVLLSRSDLVKVRYLINIPIAMATCIQILPGDHRSTAPSILLPPPP